MTKSELKKYAEKRDKKVLNDLLSLYTKLKIDSYVKYQYVILNYSINEINKTLFSGFLNQKQQRENLDLILTEDMGFVVYESYILRLMKSENKKSVQKILHSSYLSRLRRAKEFNMIDFTKWDFTI